METSLELCCWLIVWSELRTRCPRQTGALLQRRCPRVDSQSRGGYGIRHKGKISDPFFSRHILRMRLGERVGKKYFVSRFLFYLEIHPLFVFVKFCFVYAIEGRCNLSPVPQCSSIGPFLGVLMRLQACVHLRALSPVLSTVVTRAAHYTPQQYIEPLSGPEDPGLLFINGTTPGETCRAQCCDWGSSSCID